MHALRSIRRLAFTVCTMGTLALGACGDSPTDMTYSDLAGSWQGDLQSGALQGQIRLSLTQESADSVGGSGEVQWSDNPVLQVEIVSGTLDGDGGVTIWMTVDGQPGWVFRAQVSTRLDVIQGRFGTEDGFMDLWLYRR